MCSTIHGAPPGSRPDPIEWRDLAATTPADAIRELLLPAPWLFGSLILAAQELYPLALPGSMHAVQWNHLRHHRHCLAEDDIEAMGARCSAWEALLLGPRFPIRLHRAALAG